MQIGGKEYSEIIVTDSEGGLLASVTDEDIVAEKECKVDFSIRALDSARLERKEKEFDKLAVLIKPLIKYLKENYHPHAAIIITDDEVAVVETIMGIQTKSIN